MAEKRERSTWHEIQRGLYGLFVIILVAGFVNSVLTNDIHSGFFIAVVIAASVPLIAVALIALQMITVGLHELGHLFAGWAVGFRFIRVRVLWWEAARSEGKVNCKWSTPGPGVQWASSQMTPRGSRLKLRFFLYVLGGPVLGLFFSSVLACAFAVCLSEPLAALPLLIPALFSCVRSLIPFDGKTYWNDGLWLSRIIANKVDVECVQAYGQVMDAIASGQRARDWPREALETFLRLADRPSLRLHALVTNAYYLQDIGDYESAFQLLEVGCDVAGRLPEDDWMRWLVMAEHAVWACLLSKEIPNTIPEWKGEDDNSKVIRLELSAALALREGEWEEAITAAEAARAIRKGEQPIVQNSRAHFDRIIRSAECHSIQAYFEAPDHSGRTI